jgi:transcriptional regulator with XRE-family HTH domain
VPYNPVPLRRAYAKSQLTQTEIAKQLNTTHGHVSTILHGQVRSSRFLAPLCKLLDVPVASLYPKV